MGQQSRRQAVSPVARPDKAARRVFLIREFVAEAFLQRKRTKFLFALGISSRLTTCTREANVGTGTLV